MHNLMMFFLQFREDGWDAAALQPVRDFLRAEAQAGHWTPNADLPPL
jgi:hypothetical protein